MATTKIKAGPEKPPGRVTAQPAEHGRTKAASAKSAFTKGSTEAAATEAAATGAGRTGIARTEAARSSGEPAVSLPPPNGLPAAQRAAAIATSTPAALGRAQMTVAMQQAAGNARTGTMLNGSAPTAPPRTESPIGPAPAAPPEEKTPAPLKEETPAPPPRSAPAPSTAEEPAAGKAAEKVKTGERKETGAPEKAATPADVAAEPTELDVAAPTDAAKVTAEGEQKAALAPADRTEEKPGAQPVEPAEKEAEAAAEAGPGEPGEAEGMKDAVVETARQAEQAGGADAAAAAAEPVAGGGAVSPDVGGAAPEAEGGGDAEAAADELEQKLEAAAPADEAEEPGPEALSAEELSPEALSAEEAGAEEPPAPEGLPESASQPTAVSGEADVSAEPAAVEAEPESGSGVVGETEPGSEASADLSQPEGPGVDTEPVAEAADVGSVTEPAGMAGGGEVDEGAVEAEQAELSPAELDVAMGAMAEGGGGEPAGSGGGGGGGGAVPDEPAPETPEVSTLEPEAALTKAGAAPPAQLAAALSGVKAAVDGKVGQERANLAATPPTVERPAGRGAKDVEAAPAAAGREGKVEKAPEGQEKPTPEPQPLPEPPAPPVDAVREPPVQSTPEGELTEQDARRIQGSIGSLPTSDPGLYVTAGPAPQVRLEGNADPAQVDEQQARLAQSVDKTTAEGRADAAAYLGEDDIYDDQPAQTLTASIGGAVGGAGGGAAAGGGAGGAAGAGGGGEGADAEAASIIAQQEKGSEISAAVAAGKAEMAAKKQEHVDKVAEEKAKSQDEIAGLEEASAEEREAVRKGAKEDVGKQRGEWTAEQESAIEDANEDADTEIKAGQQKVDDEKRTADEQARKEIHKGDEEAERERLKAEREAQQKKKEAEEESSGLLGWLASKAKSFFNKIKSAIKKAFDAARKLVKAAIEKAKELAAKAIEAARKAIVAAIKAVGDALIAIGDRLLKHFPALREKFRKAIKSVVDKAVDTVNKLAEELNAAIQKALDVLGAALDAALGLLEKGLLAAVDAVSSAVEGALKFANSVVQALAAFAVLIKDVAAGPLQWLKNLGAGVVDGIRNHLWKSFKSAVKEWFNAKVQEVLGLGAAIWKLLIGGGLTVAQIGKMAWEGIKAMIPMAVIQILVEKLVSMIVPAAGAVKMIIEGLQAAWGSVSRIIQAFSKFLAFLKAVKSGNAGPPFAAAVAAAAVAVIDFIANWLLLKLAKGAQKVGGKLKGIARRIKNKKRTKAARKKSKAARKAEARPRRGARPRPKPRPKPARRPKTAKQSPKRKDKQRQDNERKKHERLEKARRELPPKVNPLLRQGISRVSLAVRLAAWRIQYRLRKLRFEPAGQRRDLIAAASPGVKITDSLRIDRIQLLKMIKEIAAEVYNHMLSKAGGREIQRRAEMAPKTPSGSIESAVDISGIGLPGAARYFASRKHPGWFRQAVFQLGGPDSLVRIQQFGTPVISGATSREGGGFGRVRLGTTQEIGESLAELRDPRMVAEGLRAAARGRFAGTGGEASTRMAAAAFWMFGLEGHRRTSSLVTSAMITQLMGRGMDPREAMKLFPMGPTGAVQTSKEIDDMMAGKKKYSDLSADAQKMADTEVKLVRTWVAKVIEGKEISDEAALRREIREEVLRFYALHPDQLKPKSKAG